MSVALVDETQTNPPADGGRDAAVGQLQLGAVNLGLIALERALMLVDLGQLRVKLLFGDQIAAEQNFEAFEIALGVLEQGLVARHLPFSLGELHMKRARIDLR